MAATVEGQEEAKPTALETALEAMGQRVMGFVEDLGAQTILALQVPLMLLRPPFRPWIWLQQMEAVGAGTFFIVMLTGLFVGAVLALQGLRAFGVFNAETMVGATVELGLARTLAPVFTGLMLTARTGSAIATELGTMRVTEQIDALETMAVDAKQYLIAPRVLAGFLMTPLLTLVFNAMGLLGAYFVSVVSFGMSGADFQTRIPLFTEVGDIFHGLHKAALFGYVICLVACHRGFNATGGAAGVGVATTRAVVAGSVSVLMLDYCVTSLFYFFNPNA